MLRVFLETSSHDLGGVGGEVLFHGPLSQYLTLSYLPESQLSPLSIPGDVWLLPSVGFPNAIVPRQAISLPSLGVLTNRRHKYSLSCLISGPYRWLSQDERTRADPVIQGVTRYSGQRALERGLRIAGLVKHQIGFGERPESCVRGLQSSDCST